MSGTSSSGATHEARSMWDLLALQTQLGAERAFHRAAAAQLAELELEQRQREQSIAQLERVLSAPTGYVAHAETEALARRLAPVLLGDREPHPFQIQAPSALHERRHVCVLEQAGRGKSVCYQIAALMRSATDGAVRPKLFVVVTPLVALAREQCAELNARKTYVAADGLGSTRSLAYVLDGGSQSLFTGAHEGAAAPTTEALVGALSEPPPLPECSAEALFLERLQERDASGGAMCMVLYVSPEKLVRGRALHALLRVAYDAGYWDQLALDEAHCVDEHGLEFRPDYRVLGALLRTFPRLALMLLTATAPPESVVSLCLSLGIESEPVVLRGSTRREQTAYRCIVCTDGTQKTAALCDAVARAQRRKLSLLTYTNSRRGAEELAEAFRTVCGMPAAGTDDAPPGPVEAYHAGMRHDRRCELEAAWRIGGVRQLASTNAMGMGMDKGDVDGVLHHKPPRSLTAMYQEAARGGRRGQPSKWRWYVTLGDLIELFERRQGDLAHNAHGQEYGYGLCLDVLSFLLDETTCRHQLFEAAVGSGARTCAPCPADWQCDNCHRQTAEAAAVEVRRDQWVPALLGLMASYSAQPTLRAFAAAWLRLRDGPKPSWLRVPLLLHVLHIGVLRVTFRAPEQQHTTDLSDDVRPARWVALVAIDACGRRLANSSPALARLRLHESLWHSQLAAAASGAEATADEIACIEDGGDASDLESEYELQSEDEVELVDEEEEAAVGIGAAA